MAFPKDRELVLDRYIDAPRSAVWRCWTEPELMVKWFTPKPWSTRGAEVDLRPGGSCLVVMVDPDGKEFPNPGIYLEIVPEEKLVTTDAYIRAWEPSENPFMTTIITLADEGSGTRYRAVCRHFTEEGRKQHEEMGFKTGWNAAADQLEALARTL